MTPTRSLDAALVAWVQDETKVAKFRVWLAKAVADPYRLHWEHATVLKLAELLAHRDTQLAAQAGLVAHNERIRAEWGADIELRLVTARQVADAMEVLQPSMPEQGIVDACKQRMQAWLSERGNAVELERQLDAVRTLRDRCWTMREQENAEEMRWFAQELDKALADPPRVAPVDRLDHRTRIYVEDYRRQYAQEGEDDRLEYLFSVIDKLAPRPEPEGETT